MSATRAAVRAGLKGPEKKQAAKKGPPRRQRPAQGAKLRVAHISDAQARRRAQRFEAATRHSLFQARVADTSQPQTQAEITDFAFAICRRFIENVGASHEVQASAARKETVVKKSTTDLEKLKPRDYFDDDVTVEFLHAQLEALLTTYSAAKKKTKLKKYSNYIKFQQKAIKILVAASFKGCFHADVLSAYLSVALRKNAIEPSLAKLSSFLDQIKSFGH